MTEFKVGERITLEVVETNKKSCDGCFFDVKDICRIHNKYPCYQRRKDHKNVIYKLVEPKK